MAYILTSTLTSATLTSILTAIFIREHKNIALTALFIIIKHLPRALVLINNTNAVFQFLISNTKSVYWFYREKDFIMSCMT